MNEMYKRLIGVLKEHPGKQEVSKHIAAIDQYATNPENINKMLTAARDSLETAEEKHAFIKKVASIMVEDITFKMSLNESLNQIGEVRDKSMGDTYTVYEKNPFSCYTLVPGESSVTQRRETEQTTIPTSILDVEVEASIFRVLSGHIDPQKIKMDMQRTLVFKMFYLAFGVLVSANETDSDFYDTSTDDLSSLMGAVDGIARKMQDAGNRGRGLMGLASNVYILSDYITDSGNAINYSERQKEAIDFGQFRQYKGMNLVLVEKPSDLDGNSLIGDDVDDYIVILPQRGVYIAKESTGHSFEGYDIKDKKWYYSLFIEFGILVQENKVGIVKITHS